MIPTNSSGRSTAPMVNSSKGILWQGPDLHCINVCKGDSVTDVTVALAEEVCKLLDAMNLTDIEFKCLLTTCLACPEPDKTLKTAIRLLIDKVCYLEDLIGKSGTEPPQIPVFQANMKCLAIVDGSGNILNDDSNDKIVQSIIDQVCQNKADIELVKNDVSGLDTRVTKLEETSKPPTIPNVNSNCLFLGQKPLNEAFNDLDASYCEITNVLGTPSDFNKVIAQQCPDLSQKFITNPNFSISPKNVAQSMRNMWIALCDALDRVKLIEQTCCQATCDKVKIGFNIVFSEVQTATIKFTSGAGTNIPTGIVDCGSTLIVSDEFGTSVVVENLNINNNVEVPDIDMTGFTEGGLLTFTVHSKMCGESIGTCEKVTVKTAIYKNACSTCEVTNSGDGEVLLTYESSGGFITNDITIVQPPVPPTDPGGEVS